MSLRVKRGNLTMQLIDQIGRKVHLNTVPKRIVCLVPSQTELLYDLGLEESIVGITKFCVHPEFLLNCKTVVGGTKKINIQKIISLNPDIILCNKEENTEEIVKACEVICAVHVSNINTIDHNLELIFQYGRLFDKSTKANILTEKLKEKLQEFKHEIQRGPCFNVAYFIWKDPWMVAGNVTFINHMIELLGWTNGYGHLNRYPEVNLNDMSNKIDFALLSSEPYPFKQKHIDHIRDLHPNLKIKLVDGEYFSWYGSRLLLALNYFKNLRQELEVLSV
jgi:ABC-type Fe3+-hydroxamate transport system substrate-binding protein